MNDYTDFTLATYIKKRTFSLHIKMKYMKKIIYTLSITIFTCLSTAQMYGQAIPYGGLIGGFGIDRDLYANQLLGIGGTASGTDDWFYSSGLAGSGVGVIDQSNAAALYTFYNNPANINVPFTRHMAYNYFANVNGNTLIDAVYTRDNFGGTNAAGNFADQTVFVIASKNGEPPSTWSPGTGNVANKNDILDSYSHVRREGTGLTGDMYLYTGVSLNTTEGARYVDFEFFQKPVGFSQTPTPAFTNGGATEEGHTAFLFNSTGGITRAGDMIFAVELASGGVQAFELRIWMSRALYNAYRVSPPANLPFTLGPNFDGASNGSTYGYAQILPKGGGSFDAAGIINNTLITGPPWGATYNGTNTPYYIPGQFAEIGLNLTQLGIDPLLINSGGDLCAAAFSRFMVKTRASNSFTAQLQDFIAPAPFGNPPAFMAMLSASNVLTCTQPTATLTATTTPALLQLYYTWTLPDGSTVSGTDLTTIPATMPGTYSVGIAPVTGCMVRATATYTVLQDKTPPAAPTGAVNAEYCIGSSIPPLSVANPGAGFLVNWYDMPTGGTLLATGVSYTPTAPGTYYTEMYKIASGCVSATRTPVTLTQNPVPTATTSTVIPCAGINNGTATVIPAGGTPGYTYMWSTGGATATISGLATGNYQVTVKDSKMCTVVQTATVEAAIPIVLNSTVTPVRCNGETNGAIDLTASGGTPSLTFMWSNGAATEDIGSLNANTYTVTVKDGNNCTKSLTVAVPQPADLAITGIVTNVLCNGGATGAIDITPTGGTSPYTYTWSNAAATQDLAGLIAGSYTVEVTDDNGCTETYTAMVTEPTVLTAAVVPTAVLCYGMATGSVNLTASGGVTPYTYTWSNGRTTEDLTGVVAGTYTVTVKDGNNCTTNTSTTVTQPLAALSATAITTNIACNGSANGAIDVTPAGGTVPYTFAWSNGAITEDLSGLSPGTYTVTVKDASNCTTVLSRTITQPPPLALSAVVTNATCPNVADGAVDLTVTGGTPGYIYAWSNSAVTQDILNVLPNTYTVTVTDQNGCTSSLSATVSYINKLPTPPTTIQH